jgi:DNA-binding HxlR family transcriptional regulator
MYQVCDADFCRQLERELNAANEMFRKLNIHALNLTDRIRRLEEAGDLMVQHFYTDEPRSEMWEKAKEAKP